MIVTGPRNVCTIARADIAVCIVRVAHARTAHLSNPRESGLDRRSRQRLRLYHFSM